MIYSHLRIITELPTLTPNLTQTSTTTTLFPFVPLSLARSDSWVQPLAPCAPMNELSSFRSRSPQVQHTPSIPLINTRYQPTL